MTPSYVMAILLLCLIPLFYALYYFGFLVTRATASWFRADLSLPTRWEGKSAGTTGLMRRNFVVFKRYSKLSIEIEAASGAMDFEVRGPDGSTLPPDSGTYGQSTSVRLDLSGVRRCSVTLRMEQFHGSFHISLQ